MQKGGEFCIVSLFFNQRLWGNGRADCFHAGPSVGDHIVLPADMPDIRRDLRYIVEVVELPWSALVALLAEGLGQWLVVGADHEVSCLQHVSEVFYSIVKSQQFSVIGGIFLLRRTHFLRKGG